MPGKPKTVYQCPEPPCIHIVVDERRRVFKVFIEDYDMIIPIPVEELSKACNRLRGIEKLREAYGDEVDYLARRYLEAEPREAD